jgi:hypothetical protein
VVFEEGKYVALSRRRFKSVHAHGPSAALVVTLRGAVGEIVKLVALRPRAGGPGGSGGGEWTVVTAHVAIGAAGLTTVTIR